MAIDSTKLGLNPAILEVAIMTSAVDDIDFTWSNLMTVKGQADAFSFTRIASITDFEASIDGSKKILIETDDNGTISYDNGVITMKCNWLETFDSDAVVKLAWMLKSTVAGSPTTVTAEAKGTGWTVAKPIKLNNKNGANTIVSSIVIKANAVALVLNTDYKTYVGDGTNGELGYTYIVPLTAQTLTITADYSYTPSSAVIYGNNIGARLGKALIIRATSTDPITAKNKIEYIVDWDFDGQLLKTFVDLGRAGAPKGSSLSFTGRRKGKSFTYEQV